MCARKSSTKQQAPTAEKKIRTCVTCGCKLTKSSLYRVVRTADNTCVFDASGKVAGRGSYVCSLACLEKAYKQGKLARTLKASLDADSYTMIHDAMVCALGREESEQE